MNRNRMLVLAIVALILSGAVTYLAYRVLQTRLQPAVATAQVVIAAKKLELGQRITKEDLKLVEWPKSTPLEGSFSDLNLVVGRGTIAPVQVNEPILESRLASKEAGVGLMTVIPEGMRALTIQVDSVIGVSGFVLPGSRVDMILTAVPPEDVRGAKNNEMGSKIILENLEVLAAGQNVQRNAEGKPQTVQDVTLLLTPDQAQKVALATGDGRIRLALRNPMDKAAAEPQLVVRSGLYSGPTMEAQLDQTVAKTPPEKPAEKSAGGAKKASRPTAVTAAKPKKPAPIVVAPAPAPLQRTIVVELIQGTRRSKDSFQEENTEPTEKTTQPDGMNQ